MAHGGKREGAGRKPGAFNKASIERQAEVAAGGITPLEYMLQVMRTSEDEAKRLDAAKAAAPYVHPRLNATTFDGKVGVLSHEEWLDSLK